MTYESNGRTDNRGLWTAENITWRGEFARHVTGWLPAR